MKPRSNKSFSQMMFLAVFAASLFVGLAVHAADAKPAVDPIQAEFDRVVKMTFAEQQAWLVQLEQRAAKAAQLTLSSEEAARQQKHIQSLLHQKTATWKVLREVIADTQAREKTINAAEVAKIAKPQAVVKPKVVTETKPQAVVKPQEKKQEVVQVEKPLAEEKQQDMQQIAGKLAAKLQETIAKAQAFVEKPQAAAEKKQVEKPIVPSAPVVKPSAAADTVTDSVKVNVKELEAQIAGCNLAIREFDAALDEKEASAKWDATKLEPLVERLKILVVRRNDLNLFRNLVPKGQREGVAKLESPKSAISQLSTRVFEARTLASDSKTISDDVERQAELTRLDAISHQLAEIAEKK